jgi:Uma2 family endonuclease
MQSALLETPTDSLEEEKVPSRNHSYLQTVLTVELFKLAQFTVYTELSLDIDGKEYVPDIALYPQAMEIDNFQEDVLRMTDMPLGVIEILSPRQFIESKTEKFKLYFNAGIQSCWLVVPNMRFISVYSDFTSYRLFSTDEVIDEKLNIRLPLTKVFPRKQEHES